MTETAKKHFQYASQSLRERYLSSYIKSKKIMDDAEYRYFKLCGLYQWLVR